MALTKVSGGILDPGINVAGIVTATGFDGPFTGGTGSNITAGIITCTELDLNGNGNISGNLVIDGNLTANGDFTTLNTTLREVEILRVDANTTAGAGIITQRGSGNILELYDTSTNVLTVADGGTVGIGSATPLSAMALDVVGSIRYSNQSRGAGGSAAEPSYAFYGDHDTGMYRGAGVNILSFATAGTERLNLDADGVATFLGATGINTGVKIQQTALNYSAGLEINATNGGQAALKLKASKSGTNRATRIDFFNQDSTDPKWTLINDWPQDGSNDFSIRYSNSNKIAINCTPDNQVKLYNNGNVKLETKGYGIDITGGFITTGGSIVNDGGNIKFGTHSDLQIFHDNSNNINVIQSHNGRTLHIDKDNGSANMAKFIPDGAVELYHSGTRRFRTTADGVIISNITNNEGLTLSGVGNNTCIKFLSTGSSPAHGYRIAYHSTTNYVFNSPAITFDKIATNGNFSNHIAAVSDDGFHLLDNKKLHIGGVANSSSATGDLQLYHNGSNSIIKNNTGELEIRGSVVKILGATGAEASVFTRAGSVELTHNGVKKFETTQTGAFVTGEVAASQDYPNFQPIIDFNFIAEKKLDPRITYQRTGPASHYTELGLLKVVGENAPRFDYDPVTRESKGLLIEESRSNYKTYSRDFSSGWNISGVRDFRTNNDTSIETPEGITDSVGVMPLIEVSGGNAHIFYAASTSQVTKYVTYSLFAKPNGRNHIQLHDGPFVHDLVNGTTSGSATGEYVSATTTKLSNGWCRCTMTRNHNNSYDQFKIVLHNGSAPAYSGDGISGVYIWGVQQEDGSFPTSYIPTNGTAVTRGADTAFIDGDDFDNIYNDSEGTFVLQATTGDLSSSNQAAWGVEKTSNRSGHFSVVGYRVGGGGSGNTGAWYNANGSTSAFFNMSAGVTAEIPFKIALSYKLNDMNASTNGSTETRDTSAAIDPDFDRFTLGSYHFGSMKIGYIQRAIYYSSKITDNQLKTITS